MTARRRDSLVLAATGALALAVPAVASAHLAARVAALGPALSELTGEPSRIGGVEAGLTGSVRITGLEIGDVLRVAAVEAATSPDRLLAGALGADEVRLERPRLRVHVDGAGTSNVARILRRIDARRAARPAGGSGRRLRRIVVTEGALVLDVVGVGRFEARELELHPQRGGVRVVTGPVRARVAAGPVAIDASFARGGGDLDLPDARPRRLLAVGGTAAIHAGRPGAAPAPPLTIRGAALGWNVWGAGALGLRGDVDDHGVPRPVVVTARPGGADAALDVRGADLPLAALAALAPRGVDLAGARATGALTVARAPRGWTAVVDGAVAGVAIDHPAVADRRFAVDAAITARVRRDGPTVALEAATLRRGALVLDARGRVRGGRAGELELAVADARCLDLIAALPDQVRGPVGALVLDGRFAATARLAVDLDLPPGEGVELDVTTDDRCVALADPPEADAPALAGVVDHRFPDGSLAPVGPGVGDWTPMIRLPGHVDGAFVAAEDARFFAHRGFDPVQIARSLEIDLRERRFARGGSTISQQLVKNALLSHRRTLDRKLQEAILTWRLEAALTKRQILERYLNVVELGPGVHGIAAGARHWFGKAPADLSVKEAAFLAALTPEPRRMAARIAAAGGLDPHSADRVETVLRHMARAGVIDAAARDDARRARLTFRDAALAPPAHAATAAATGRRLTAR